jgi:hypothetical protein
MKLSNKFPRIVDKYKGIEIWFDPFKGRFFASHCEHTKRDESIIVVKKWLDKYKF